MQVQSDTDNRDQMPAAKTEGGRLVEPQSRMMYSTYFYTCCLRLKAKLTAVLTTNFRVQLLPAIIHTPKAGYCSHFHRKKVRKATFKIFFLMKVVTE